MDLRFGVPCCFVMFLLAWVPHRVDLIGFRHNKSPDVKEAVRFTPDPTLNEELAVYAEQDIDHVNDVLNAKQDETKDTDGKPDTKANKAKPDFHADIRYKYTGEIFTREKKSLQAPPPHKDVKDVKEMKVDDDDTARYSHFCLQGLPGKIKGVNSSHQKFNMAFPILPSLFIRMLFIHFGER